MKSYVDLSKFRAEAEAAVVAIAEAAGIERPVVHVRVEEARLNKPRIVEIIVEDREHLVDEYALRTEHWAEHGN